VTRQCYTKCDDQNDWELLMYRHEAERLEQEAKGRLERQKITDEAEAERSRKELLELQANSAAVESTGQAKAEAQSRAEAAKIEGEAAVDQAKLKAEAMKIEAVSSCSRDLCVTVVVLVSHSRLMFLNRSLNKKFIGMTPSAFKNLLKTHLFSLSYNM